jgi:hypothetical protein
MADRRDYLLPRGPGEDLTVVRWDLSHADQAHGWRDDAKIICSTAQMEVPRDQLLIEECKATTDGLLAHQIFLNGLRDVVDRCRLRHFLNLHISRNSRQTNAFGNLLIHIDDSRDLSLGK